MIHRSDVRTATDPKKPNLRAEGRIINPVTEEDPVEDQAQPSTNPNYLPRFTPDELIGRTFLKEGEHGDIMKSKIVRKLKQDNQIRQDQVKFLIQSDNGTNVKIEEVMNYLHLCDLIERQLRAINTDNDDAIHAFTKILGHDGPFRQGQRKYKGSTWNLLIQWDNGEETWEPRDLIEETDKISVALYARDNHLLDTHGWKKYKAILPQLKDVNRILKAKFFNPNPVYKYGIRLPDRSKSFKDLDNENKNTLWQDAIDKEITIFKEMEVFETNDEDKALMDLLMKKGYQKIRTQWVYDVKHDGRRRARMVAGGHTTFLEDGESSYSSVAHLRTIRMVLLYGELNGLKMMIGDVSSAYLMAKTHEKVFFITGPEFGADKGKIMIVSKALYGLKSSGRRYHDFMFDTMIDMGFKPCKADPDVWMRDADTCYEYVCIYVDDLLVMMKQPQAFFDELISRGYALKGVTDKPDVYLGGNFNRDHDGTLVWGAKKYIARSLQNIEQIYGFKPEVESVPMAEGTHPELETSEFLDATGISNYQSAIGMLLWTVTLGRFDIAFATMSLSRFRVQPRKTHEAMILKIFGYLRKYPDGAIRFRTGVPNHEASFTAPLQRWDRLQYETGTAPEEIPEDQLPPKGLPVRISAWFDANLYHDIVTGHAAMGQLIMINQTPIYWNSKKQSTVETATYASEFIAGRVCAEEVMGIRFELRMLGIPLDGPSWLFGDNKAMINSSMIPEGKLTKRSIALAYHKVREQVANGSMYYFHIDGKVNISDCLTKSLNRTVLWKLIKPVLFNKAQPPEKHGIEATAHMCHCSGWGVTTQSLLIQPNRLYKRSRPNLKKQQIGTA